MFKVDYLENKIKAAAYEIHAEVNQMYDNRPYGYHLDMVANFVKEYISEDNEHYMGVIFGAYFHDTIEDARLTYNNVMELAKMYLDDEDALIGTEIVYALTNEKGRTRAERANDKYYNDICNTPYAPLVKMADRMANMSYSIEKGSTMANVYRKELPHFIEAITKNNKNLPPKEMIEDLKKIVM